MKKYLISIILILSLVTLQYFGIIWHTSLFTVPYKIEGIDISHWQGKIDWVKVEEEKKYSFVYMKATEGDDYVDKTFEYNWKEARKNGFKVGAYHFFSMRSGGKEQFEKIIEVVKKEKDSLPFVVDVEISTSHKKEKVEKELKFLMKKLEEYYGKKPVLYVTYDTYNAYIKGNFSDYKLWFRDIFLPPHGIEKKWNFWQYSNRGHINGIKGYVDKNVFYGNEEEFLEFTDAITNREKAERYRDEKKNIFYDSVYSFNQLQNRNDIFEKLIKLDNKNPKWYSEGVLMLPLTDRQTENKEIQNKSYLMAEKLGLEGIKKFCNEDKIKLIEKEDSIIEIVNNKKYKNICKKSEIADKMFYLYLFQKDELQKGILYNKISLQLSSLKKYSVLLPIFLRKNGDFKIAFNNFLEVYELYGEKSKKSDGFYNKLKEIKSLDNISEEIEKINNEGKKLFSTFDENKISKNYLNKAVRTLNLYYLNEVYKKCLKNKGKKFILTKELKDNSCIDFVPVDFQKGMIYKYSEKYGIFYSEMELLD